MAYILYQIYSLKADAAVLNSITDPILGEYIPRDMFIQISL